jgi:Undecaprenyl-phosphate galactose phosphotransferase WbaP
MPSKNLELVTNPAIEQLRVATHPWWTVAMLVLADALALTLAWLFSVWGRTCFDGEISWMLYVKLWPVLGLFLLVYAAVDLYPAIFLSSTEELRRTTWTTSLLYLGIGALTFLMRGAEVYSRAVFLSGWVLSLVFIPASRAIVRGFFAPCAWWGYSVVVMGAGKTGSMVVRNLRQWPSLGFKVLAVLDDDPAKQSQIHDVPVIGGLEYAPLFAKKFGIDYAIFAMPGVQRERLLELLEQYGQTFPHLFIIPDLFGFSSLWVNAKDLGGILGLEVCQNLFDPWAQRVKKCLDIVSVVLSSVFMLPLILLIALLCKLDSRGPAFFVQERLGKDGRRFMALKFRTMYSDAEEKLQELLQANPLLRQEYEVYHKLRQDPRVTRIGRFLRKTSLDELPQLWNILKGEMSLVGPRAYMPKELPKMRNAEKVILRVQPGLTGLWQVSGRNRLTFDQRLDLDIYYVRNWSLWFDIYILASTVHVLFWDNGGAC